MNDLDELNPREREFAATAQRLLRESEQLDALTAARLAAARHRALEGAGKRGWRSSLILGVPAALAAALLLSIAAPRWLSPAATAVTPGEIEALGVAADADELDPQFYEDLDLSEALDDARGA